MRGDELDYRRDWAERESLTSVIRITTRVESAKNWTKDQFREGR